MVPIIQKKKNFFHDLERLWFIINFILSILFYIKLIIKIIIYMLQNFVCTKYQRHSTL